MRIALVDDDVKFLARTARLLEILLERRRTQAEVVQYSSADRLLARLSDGRVFDVYLLDVVMPGIDGIELGRRIRRNQPDAPLLFFTTSRDFAVEAIGIEAVGYVIKPFSRDAFAEALERAFRRLANSRSPMLMLKTSDGYANVPLRDLVSAEANGHYLSVCLSGGRPLTIRLSLQELWEKLEGDVRFVRVGRRQIVNLAQVMNYSDGTLSLSNEKKVAVPRRSRAEVKSAFARFYGA